MKRIFIEENKEYQIDFTKAIWAMDSLNSIYHQAKIQLSDVDFIAETEEELIFIEYKNASIKNASNPNAFQPQADKAIQKVVRKYYDSLFYIMGLRKAREKRKYYVYILEYPKGDGVTRRAIRNKLQSSLPFLLQQQNQDMERLIDEVMVLSIDEWNERFVQFPLTKCRNNFLNN